MYAISLLDKSLINKTNNLNISSWAACNSFLNSAEKYKLFHLVFHSTDASVCRRSGQLRTMGWWMWIQWTALLFLLNWASLQVLHWYQFSRHKRPSPYFAGKSVLGHRSLWKSNVVWKIRIPIDVPYEWEPKWIFSLPKWTSSWQGTEKLADPWNFFEKTHTQKKTQQLGNITSAHAVQRKDKAVHNPCQLNKQLIKAKEWLCLGYIFYTVSTTIIDSFYLFVKSNTLALSWFNRDYTDFRGESDDKVQTQFSKWLFGISCRIGLRLDWSTVFSYVWT